jgi:hypothetical protein
MEQRQKTYSMLLPRPWFKQARAHHDWGNSTLTITSKGREVTLSTIEHVKLNPTQQPKHLDDGYDWEDGLTNQNEEKLYEVVPNVWPIGYVVNLLNYHFYLMCSMGCCNLKRKLITQNIFIGVNQRNNI